MDKKEIIFEDDPRAAEYRTGIEGWVSRTGQYFGQNENLARWSGATHKKCKECDTVNEINSYCKECHRRNDIKKYNDMPAKENSNGEMLFSMYQDEWFQDLDEVYEYCHEHNLTIDELMIVIGKPQKAHSIEPEDVYSDIIFEDNDVPDNIQKAFDTLNEEIKKCDETLSWHVGNEKLLITPEMINDSKSGII